MPDPGKTMWNNMTQKPLDKLHTRQFKVFLFVTVVSVQISKTYGCFCYFFNPVIADGNFMSITPQIFNYSFRSFEWLLTVNHPIGFVKLVFELLPYFRIKQNCSFPCCF